MPVSMGLKSSITYLKSWLVGLFLNMANHLLKCWVNGLLMEYAAHHKAYNQCFNGETLLAKKKISDEFVKQK